MRWFKHMTKSWDDEKIAELVEREGLEGYGFYFRLLEIVAATIEENSEPVVTYSTQRWSKLTAIFQPKVLRLCQVCADLDLIEYCLSSKNLKVSIPKILKYRDEYGNRKAKAIVKNRDNIPTDSRQTPEQDTEAEQKQIQIQIQNNTTNDLPKKKRKSPAVEVDADYISEMKRLFPMKDIDSAIPEMQAWLLAHPGRKYTRKFFGNWIKGAKDIVEEYEYDFEKENPEGFRQLMIIEEQIQAEKEAKKNGVDKKSA